MRILHCTDFHANARWFRWFAENAIRYDLASLTGDFLDLVDFQSIDAQIGMAREVLEGIGSPTALTSGNNDSFNADGSPLWLLHAKWLADMRRPGCWVDGDELEIEGLRIRCIGWNARLPSANGDEIWLCHAPPARSSVSVDRWGGDAGDEILGEVCRAGAGPALLLSGHQHHPQSWSCRIGRTWALNPGRGSDPTEPNHIVIDTLTRTATVRINAQHHSTIHLS